MAGKKNGPAAASKGGKKIAGMMDVARSEKKNLIQIAILLAAFVLVAIVASYASFSQDGIFKGMYAELNAEYNALVNDINKFRTENPYYTGIGRDEDSHKEVNWIGTAVDKGRMQADTKAFLDWIRPAFEYEDQAGYEAMKKEFEAKGVPRDSVFLSGFLSYLDNVGINEFNYYDWIRLAGSDADGDYHYFAMVPVNMTGNRKSGKYTMVAFTFTAKHRIAADNSVDISIADFNVWPPDPKALTVIDGITYR